MFRNFLNKFLRFLSYFLQNISPKFRSVWAYKLAPIIGAPKLRGVWRYRQPSVRPYREDNKYTIQIRYTVYQILVDKPKIPIKNSKNKKFYPDTNPENNPFYIFALENIIWSWRSGRGSKFDDRTASVKSVCVND